MTLTKYIESRGLTLKLVAAKSGCRKQYLSQLSCGTRNITLKLAERIAGAMTELGAPTTVVDLTRAIYAKEQESCYV